MLIDKLHDGQPCLGSWCQLGHPATAGILARAGFAWLALRLARQALPVDR